MICVPVIAETNEEAKNKISQAASVADLIELRIDYLPHPDLSALLKNKPKPIIVTCRTAKDRGQYGVARERANENETNRTRLLLEALEGGADYVDVEYDAPEATQRKIMEFASPARTILSYHNFENTPDNLKEIKEKMASIAPGATIKIVTMAKTINDNLKIFDLLKSTKKEEKVAAFCMGDHGEISRILSPVFGGEFTFGSLSPGEESAPGQIPASRLKDIYRANLLKDDVEIYGLIGNPVKESMGYLIHNKSFIRAGMNKIYLPFLVEDLKSFVDNFKELFKGVSVTMPFKQDIIPLLDEVDVTAAKIGAVNTIHVKDGKLKGYNTDSSGAIQAIEDLTPLAEKKVLMIGAGGVARAIGFGAVQKGAQICISDVDKKKAEELSAELGGRLCAPGDWEDMDYDILINCSPVGMYPRIDETPFPKTLLKPGTVVFDAIYNPLETRLLKEAAEIGCPIIRGVDLFINQAVGQFELWTGEKAPKDVMTEVVLEKLRQSR